MPQHTPAIALWTDVQAADAAQRLRNGAPAALALQVDSREAAGLLGRGGYAAAEQARAARLRFDPQRREYLVARGIVRSVLGLHLGVAPADVPFVAAPNRKPALASGAAVDVSISHSHGWVLCGFAPRRRIGVDLEVDTGRPMPDLEALAARILTPGERRGYDALPPDAQRAWFHEAWRRKEAVLKAGGVGLTHDPALLEVLRCDPAGGLAGLPEVTFDGARWQVLALPVPGGPAAALALEKD